MHAPHLRVVQVEAGVGGGERHRGPRVHSHYEGLLASCRQNIRPHQMAGQHMKLTDKRLCNGHGLNAERYSAHLRLECESVGRGGHSDRDLLNTIWAVGEAMRC